VELFFIKKRKGMYVGNSFADVRHLASLCQWSCYTAMACGFFFFEHPMACGCVRTAVQLCSFASSVFGLVAVLRCCTRVFFLRGYTAYLGAFYALINSIQIDLVNSLANYSLQPRQ
jgi:hypothetical protein